MSEIPELLNWVKVRGECVLATMFRRLRDEIIGDIAVRQGQLSADSPIKFELEDRESEFFAVHRRHGTLAASSVGFDIARGTIRALDVKGSVIIEADIGMNDSGRCVLRAKGADLETWQFRKRALESLFFWT